MTHGLDTGSLLVFLLGRRLGRGRVFGQAAVPERGCVLRVPALPGLAEFGDQIRLLGGEVVLLAEVFGQIEELPAAVGLFLEVAPIDERQIPLADRLLRAETPVEGLVRRRLVFAQ